MAKKRAHIVIHGNVQGVFFRAYMRDRAEKRKVTGWIKNCFDGTVEAVLEGEEEGVNEIVDWAHTGPADAEVKRVDVTWEKPKEEFKDFSVHY